MILALQEFRQAEFRGINFLLSPLAPRTVERMTHLANSTFQEALLAVHGNDEATLPFEGFDQESCELKVAIFRAEKRVVDRLLPKPRLHSLCYFPATKSVYVNLPNWIKIYLLGKSGDLTNTSLRNPNLDPAEPWTAISLSHDITGIALSLFEDAEEGIDDWSRIQTPPRGVSLLRLAQFLEKPSYGEPGHRLMPLWTLKLQDSER
jgi:hypothetical protein